MKFRNPEDKIRFILEEGISVDVDKVDDWSPSDDVLELFFKRRKELTGKLKSFRKSQDTKEQWRTNRYKMMKGIRAFHDSTKGKQHHRSMGRFLATRDSVFGNPYKSNEAIKALSSLETHLYIERDYYCGISEQIGLELMLDEVLPAIGRSKNALNNLSHITEEDADILLRVTETSATVAALASDSGKSVAEVEKLWDKAKDIVKKEYDKGEDDDGFFAIVVGIVKKMMGEK